MEENKLRRNKSYLKFLKLFTNVMKNMDRLSGRFESPQQMLLSQHPECNVIQEDYVPLQDQQITCQSYNFVT